jgi:transcriptional regulator with XRE-family HTH domain
MSMTETQAKKLGRLIAKARAAKGLSVKALAEQLGVATGWLGKLEQGNFLDPSRDRLARLAETLDIEPARIDRITRAPMADVLPGMRTYFRAKYDLTPDQIAEVEQYVDRLRGDS